jgi:hypothetical protein
MMWSITLAAPQRRTGRPADPAAIARRSAAVIRRNALSKWRFSAILAEQSGLAAMNSSDRNDKTGRHCPLIVLPVAPSDEAASITRGNVMNRKPIFDAVRTMLGRGFKPAEVAALDLACDLAETAVTQPEPKPPSPAAKPADTASPRPSADKLGSVSERFESGGRGPGTVSSGSGDPGGVSYGTYQLSSNAGTLTAFLKAEGKPWIARFGDTKPGSGPFSTVWKAIAGAEKEAFGAAQHKFIERTHYRPSVEAVLATKGLDLDLRHTAVREAVWSISVQHGGAKTILIDAVNTCDRDHERDAAGYDRALVEQMYKVRTAYVLRVASNPKLPKAQRDQLVSITENRYPAELADALKLFAAPDATPSAAPAVQPAAAAADGSIDGNVVAAQNNVLVKSNAVKLKKLHAKMGPAIVAVATAAKKLGLPQPVITSGNDSTHKADSLHYKWRALDFRGNNIQPSVGKQFETEVRGILGADYDVIFETFMNATNNHLHVEYDPD